MALTDEQMAKIGDTIRGVLGDGTATPDEVLEECEHHVEQWVEDNEGE